MPAVVITNGLLLDGAGRPPCPGDLALADGRIAGLGRLGSNPTAEVLDATGLVIAPGFIDCHAHSDVETLRNPACPAKVRQGVTTEVNGNCGFSPAPLSAAFADYWAARSYFLFGGLHTERATLAEHFEAVEACKPAVNYGSLVGLGALRAAVMGGEDRPPTSAELRAMKRLLAEALEQGALGLSTGLIFEPCRFASTDEIVDLCTVVRRYDRLYVSHIRGERETGIEATRELLEIGKRAGVKVHLSHLEAVDRPNWGHVPKQLALLEEARSRGVDVTFDMYPYLGSPIRVRSMLPHWAAAGSDADLAARLAQPDQRRRIVGEAYEPDWEQILVARFQGAEGDDLRGQSIAAISTDRRQCPWDTVFDLFVTDPALILTQLDLLSPADMRAAMTHPLGMIASDGTYDPDALLHPRLFSAFAEVLSRYVRQEKWLTLEEAVRKFTSAPAARFALGDRGQLRVGAVADLTLFTPPTLSSRATYTNPEQHPTGIEHVLVAGQFVVRQGQPTAARPGSVLRAPVS